MSDWTILKVLNWTAQRFADRGMASARLDAEVLLAHALGLSRVGLYTGFDKPLVDSELAAYRELVRRRLAGEPVAYLTGTQEFWSLALSVDARVLIPRRDTETLVEVGLRFARGQPADLRIADVATGSGAVALALATELPGARVVATDSSEGALAVARANVERHRLADRIELRRGDLTAPLDGEFDLIVSNPPYVRTRELAGLSVEVKLEPRAALDGGAEGLDIIERLIPAALGKLRNGGMLAVEHGWDQGEKVAELLSAAGLVETKTNSDLGNLGRVSSGLRPPDRLR